MTDDNDPYKQLLLAAEELLSQIELIPSGYDYRPYYLFKPSSQLNDPDGAVIRLKKAVINAGGRVPPSI